MEKKDLSISSSKMELYHKFVGLNISHFYSHLPNEKEKDYGEGLVVIIQTFDGKEINLPNNNILNNYHFKSNNNNKKLIFGRDYFIEKDEKGEDKIRFRKRRNYCQDPLGFFERNKEIYTGLSKMGLNRFDNGLYTILVNYGLINRAIPKNEPSKKLSKKNIEKIIKSYDKSFGCLRFAEKDLNFAQSTIKRYWREEGLEIYSQPYDFKGDPLIYFGSSKKFKEISRKKLEKKHSGFYLALKKKGKLDEAIPKKKLSQKLSDYNIRLILDSYEASYGCLYLVEDSLPFSKRTIRKYWKENNLKIYANPYHFKENPVIYFNNNLELFLGLSRSKLKEKYSGFYNSLNKYNVMDTIFDGEKVITKKAKIIKND